LYKRTKARKEYASQTVTKHHNLLDMKINVLDRPELHLILANFDITLLQIYIYTWWGEKSILQNDNANADFSTFLFIASFKTLIFSKVELLACLWSACLSRISSSCFLSSSRFRPIGSLFISLLIFSFNLSYQTGKKNHKCKIFR